MIDCLVYKHFLEKNWLVKKLVKATHNIKHVDPTKFECLIQVATFILLLILVKYITFFFYFCVLFLLWFLVLVRGVYQNLFFLKWFMYHKFVCNI